MDRLRDFIASVKVAGLARPSRFAVEITLPPKLLATFMFASQMQTILLFCDATILPGINIATTPNRSFGETREAPYERLFDSLPLSFYVDNGMMVKALFDEWTNLIQNFNTRDFSYYDDYTTKISIITFDIRNRPNYRMELHEAYPKSVSPISLDYSNKDIMKLNVNFVFKYWNITATKIMYVERSEVESGLVSIVPPLYVNNFPLYQAETQGRYTGIGY
jgi:hypothetical protein